MLSPVWLEAETNIAHGDMNDGINLLLTLTSVDFIAGLSWIPVGRVIIQQSRLKARRPSASAGPHSGKRVASFTLLYRTELTVQFEL